MSALELNALRSEIRALRAVVEALESRVSSLELGGFELAPEEGVSLGRSVSSAPRSASERPPAAASPPLTPAARPVAEHLSLLPEPSSGPSSLSAARPVAERFPSSARAPVEPGSPTGPFRQEIARAVGGLLGRAVRGEHRGPSRRGELALGSRYYIVLADFNGRLLPEAAIFSAFEPVRHAGCACVGPTRVAASSWAFLLRLRSLLPATRGLKRG